MILEIQNYLLQQAIYRFLKITRVCFITFVIVKQTFSWLSAKIVIEILSHQLID